MLLINLFMSILMNTHLHVRFLWCC